MEAQWVPLLYPRMLSSNTAHQIVTKLVTGRTDHVLSANKTIGKKLLSDLDCRWRLATGQDRRMAISDMTFLIALRSDLTSHSCYSRVLSRIAHLVTSLNSKSNIIADHRFLVWLKRRRLLLAPMDSIIQSEKWRRPPVHIQCDSGSNCIPSNILVPI